MPMATNDPSAAAMIKMHLTAKPTPIRDHNTEIPEPLAEVIMQAIDYNPASRPSLQHITQTLQTFRGERRRQAAT